MKNDLTTFEKDLLKSINLCNGTNFTYKNFMEWSTDRNYLEQNLQEGEKMYEVFGCFVAIKNNEL